LFCNDACICCCDKDGVVTDPIAKAISNVLTRRDIAIFFRLKIPSGRPIKN
jgi:hypothetical protein